MYQFEKITIKAENVIYFEMEKWYFSKKIAAR